MLRELLSETQRSFDGVFHCKQPELCIFVMDDYRTGLPLQGPEGFRGPLSQSFRMQVAVINFVFLDA